MSSKTASRRSNPPKRTVQTQRAQPNLQRAPMGGGPNPAEMQQRLGNRGTQAWLTEQGSGQPVQAKLTVGEPDDKYEQEADRVADTVMRMPEPAMPDDDDTKVQAKPIADQITPLVQRMPVEAVEEDPVVQQMSEPETEEEDEENVVAQRVLSIEPEEGNKQEEIAQSKLETTDSPAIQRQMDEDEEELKTKPLIQRQPEEEEEKIQAKQFSNDSPDIGIQRVCTECKQNMQRQPEEEEELIQTKPLVKGQIALKETQIQPKGTSAQTPQVTPDITANVNALKSGGSSLLQSTRAFFEPRFDTDFSQVRVHTDSRAADTATSINAKAFTVGENIAFGKGQYAPESQEGKRLLGHELTHVVQQNGSQLQRVQETIGSNSLKSTMPPNPNLSFIQRDDGDDEEVVVDSDVEEQLDNMFYDYVEDYEQIANDAREEEPLLSAKYRRAVLLMNHEKPEIFVDEDTLENLVSELLIDADSEEDTLNTLGLNVLWDFPEAFPETWAEDIEEALNLELDVEGRLEAHDTSKELLGETLSQIPEQLLESGLPVDHSTALSLSGFELSYDHIDLDKDHIVRSYARALNRYATLKAALTFCLAWNGQTKSFVKKIKNGEITVIPTQYELFLEKEAGFLTEIPEHIANTSNPDDRESLLGEVFEGSYGQFNGLVIGAALQVLLVGINTWEAGKRQFTHKLAEADKAIRGESYWDRVWRAIEWAEHNDYFSAAIKEQWQALVENAWLIAGAAAALTAALVAVQFVPVLNVVVDIIFLAWGGYEILKTVVEVKKVLDTTGNATSVVSLQKASAKMANLSADKLQTFIEFIAGKGAHKLIKTVAKRAKKLRKDNKDITDKEAVEQATKEVQDEGKIPKGEEELHTKGSSKEDDKLSVEERAPQPDEPAHGCFIKGTEVITPEGTRTIEQLKIGDLVVTANPETKHRENRAIFRVFTHEVQEVLDIVIGNTILTCSLEHPFWVIGIGWKRAAELVPGVCLTTEDFQTIAIDSIQLRSDLHFVYNIEVDGSHTYFVSPIGILVHNKPVKRTIESRVEDAVIDEMQRRPGGEYAETWEITELSKPREIANLDPNLGSNQVRYQATFVETMTGETHNISVNYDIDTGIFGIIKFASGK